MDQTEASLLERLGRELRRHREAAGKSQEMLALDCGLHRTYVGAVERGERNPTFLSLHKYSSALQMTVAQLVGDVR